MTRKNAEGSQPYASEPDSAVADEQRVPEAKGPSVQRVAAALLERDCWSEIIAAACTHPDPMIRVMAINHPRVSLDQAWQIFSQAVEYLRSIPGGTKSEREIGPTRNIGLPHPSTVSGSSRRWGWVARKKAEDRWARLHLRGSTLEQIRAACETPVDPYLSYVISLAERIGEYRWEDVQRVTSDRVLYGHLKLLLTPFLEDAARTGNRRQRLAVLNHYVKSWKALEILTRDPDDEIRQTAQTRILMATL